MEETHPNRSSHVGKLRLNNDGINISTSRPKAGKCDTLVCTGVLDHAPNIELRGVQRLPSDLLKRTALSADATESPDIPPFPSSIAQGRSLSLVHPI